MSWRYSDFIFRPIGNDWPSDRPRLSRGMQQRSPFSAVWTRTLRDLELELRQLDAEHVVLQIDVPERMIRVDGKPRADASPAESAVILSFDSKYGPLRYACDEYRSWQDNVRAIALSLKALRAVDRYGVSKRGEQFTGWKALPAAGGLASVAEARAFVEEHGGLRAAIKKFHPDHGGSREDFARVLRAKELIEA